MRADIMKPAAVAAIAAVLTGCGASGPGVPGSVQAAQRTSHAGRDAAPRNLSGQYAGTISDSVHGKRKVVVSLAQTGAGLGGTLTVAGSAGAADVAWTQRGDAVDGTFVAVNAHGYCQFAATGNYHASTYEVTGKYRAVHSCAGETGTYRLEHKCLYENGAADAAGWTIGPKGC